MGDRLGKPRVVGFPFSFYPLDHLKESQFPPPKKVPIQFFFNTTCQANVKNKKCNKNKIVHTGKANLYSRGSACARDLIKATFMTSKLSFRLSKEQDTASEKLTHCYALDERETSGEHVYTTTATKL